MKVRNLLMTAFVCAGLATGALAAVNLEAEIENGKKLIKSGDFKKSAELFNQILTQNKDEIKNHPKHPEAWYLFSLSLRKIGRIDLADKALDRAKTLKKLLESNKGKIPEDPQRASGDKNQTASVATVSAASETASTDTGSQNETQAAADVASTAAEPPAASETAAAEPTSIKNDKARENYVKGNSLFDSGQFQAAADAYLLAVEAEPANIELLEKAIICLSNVGSGYYQKAMTVFAALEKADPARMTSAHKASYARACIFANKPDYKKAETILADILKGTPDNVEAIILSGQLDSENKLYKQAVEKFEKAIKLDKNAMQAYLGLGEAYQKMQQFSKAIEVLQKARDLWPDNFMPLVGLGKAYLKNNDYGFALVMFNLAYDMNPDNFDVNVGLLEIFARKGDYRANNHLARCEKFFKGDPRVEYWKAIFLELDERLEEAKRIYSLLAMYEDDIAYRAKLRLGQLYGGIGHETFPGNLLVADRPNYIRTYSSMNDQELAYAHLSAFVAKRPEAPEAQGARRWLDENEETLRNAREFDAFVQSQFKTE
ncbi:MAG TPA: tetratricopeptide repeat protein [Candidatus Rifleibacterium sp.]|nr:tetratricopeptide repeat protein [Candidatus Rifleibacterium sp.]